MNIILNQKIHSGVCNMKRKYKLEAHEPQCSAECTAMKAIFSQNTVNVAMATNQIQQFRLNSYGY